MIATATQNHHYPQHQVHANMEEIEKKKRMKCNHQTKRLNYAHLKSCRKPHSKSIKLRTNGKSKSNRDEKQQQQQQKIYLKKKSEIR